MKGNCENNKYKANSTHHGHARYNVCAWVLPSCAVPRDACGIATTPRPRCLPSDSPDTCGGARRPGNRPRRGGSRGRGAWQSLGSRGLAVCQGPGSGVAASGQGPASGLAAGGQGPGSGLAATGQGPSCGLAAGGRPGAWQWQQVALHPGLGHLADGGVLEPLIQ